MTLLQLKNWCLGHFLPSTHYKIDIRSSFPKWCYCGFENILRVLVGMEEVPVIWRSEKDLTHWRTLLMNWRSFVSSNIRNTFLVYTDWQTVYDTKISTNHFKVYSDTDIHMVTVQQVIGTTVDLVCCHTDCSHMRILVRADEMSTCVCLLCYGEQKEENLHTTSKNLDSSQIPVRS